MKTLVRRCKVAAAGARIPPTQSRSGAVVHACHRRAPGVEVFKHDGVLTQDRASQRTAAGRRGYNSHNSCPPLLAHQPASCMNKYQIIILALTIACLLWLWFTIAKPEQWSRFVDRENDFWVKRGMLPASLVDRFRRFEKGPGQKILIGSGAMLGVTVLIVIHLLIRSHTHR